ncbi:MAG: hypothetical protein LBB59_03610 [Campylobacteraceae bacterium]|jgi:hypothetical protein|nr:hypothetical protein [Campylobacteraceae bacterium]
MAKYVFSFFGIWILLIMSAAALFFVVGRFEAIDRFNIIVAGLTFMCTLTLFDKIEKTEPTDGEKLSLPLIAAAVSLIGCALFYLFEDISIDFLLYGLLNVFFLVLALFFHKKSQMKANMRKIDYQIH